MYKPDCFATCDWPSLIELTNLLEAIRVLQELNFIILPVQADIFVIVTLVTELNHAFS